MPNCKNILLVGGSGFLGQNLANKILELGYNVKIYDRSMPIWIKGKFDYIAGDFTSDPSIDSILNGCDVVFHLASTTLPKTSNDDPKYDISSNLLGTLRLLNSAVQNHVRKFIFASSGGTVYGVPSYLPVPEQHPTTPTCSYGIVKLSIEKYLKLYHQIYDIDTCSLRLANPYGEFQRLDGEQGAIAVFCSKALNGKEIEVWGDGSITRDYIYISDVVDAMIKSLEIDCCGHEINIGSGKGRNILHLIACIEREMGYKLNVKYLPSRQFDVPAIYLDISKAKRILDWRPKISLIDGISREINWIKRSSL